MNLNLVIHEESRKHIAKEVRELEKRLYQKITRKNPVDTGHSSANWICGLGNIPVTRRGGDFREAWTDLGASDALFYPTIERFNAAMIGMNVYLVNNVPYIVELEQGSSAQAPALWIQTSVLEEARV